MTRANQRKFEQLGARLTKSAKDNDSSSNCIYLIIDVVRILMDMATDFYMRAEVNDEGPLG